MDVMPRALRCVVIAALVVAALLVSAVSIHSMTAGSPAMGSLTAATHVMAPPADVDHSMHLSPAASSPDACDGMCVLGGALVAILCVAAAVAIVLALLLPRSDAAASMLSSVTRFAAHPAAPTHRVAALTLTQLSISRT